MPPAGPRRVGNEPENLIGLTRAELAARMQAAGVAPARAPMRVRQLWHWIYHRGATDFAHMTTVSGRLRAALAARHTLARPATAAAQRSADGTRKWLLRFADGREAEAVYIPEAERGALCVSSQVGCTLSCTFCRTGTQRLVRNLEAGEIVAQFLVARDACGEWPTPQGPRMLSNLVRAAASAATTTFRISPSGLTCWQYSAKARSAAVPGAAPMGNAASDSTASGIIADGADATPAAGAGTDDADGDAAATPGAGAGAATGAGSDGGR